MPHPPFNVEYGPMTPAPPAPPQRRALDHGTGLLFDYRFGDSRLLSNNLLRRPEIEITRQGYFKMTLDGYLVKVEL